MSIHNKRTQLNRMSKKASQSTGPHNVGLKEQYDIIRKDLLKLREDLQKGYDLAKDSMSTKNLINQFLKSR